MSDENTSEPIIGAKEKDPKRVAAGKRLGAISKQRKEEKREALRLERQNAEMEADNNYTLYFVGGLVVVGTVSYLYLNKDKLISNTRSDKKKLPTIPEEPTAGRTPPTPPPKRKSKRIFGE